MRVLFFIAFLFVFICCNEQTHNESPKDLIPKEKFTKLLCETTLLEGYLTNENVNIPAVRDKSLGRYKDIFNDFGISNEQYQSSYEYYVQQPYFKEMLEQAIQILEKKEEKILDVSEIKQMSFGQFQTLLKSDSLNFSMVLDTSISNQTKLDSISTYYKKHPQKLTVIAMDSLSFQYSLNRYREGMLFNSIVKSLSKEKNAK